MSTVLIDPQPGYLLCEQYVRDGVFKPVKEADGLDQESTVLKVGSPVKDTQGILRETDVKEGDIIHHAYSNKEIEIKFDKYRYVHFSEVHGKVTNESK